MSGMARPFDLRWNHSSKATAAAHFWSRPVLESRPLPRKERLRASPNPLRPPRQTLTRPVLPKCPLPRFPNCRNAASPPPLCYNPPIRPAFPPLSLPKTVRYEKALAPLRPPHDLRTLATYHSHTFDSSGKFTPPQVLTLAAQRPFSVQS